jgi:hypothetical protein
MPLGRGNFDRAGDFFAGQSPAAKGVAGHLYNSKDVFRRFFPYF